MEVEGTFAGCYPDLIIEPSPEHESSSKKSSGGAPPANACFDCNICLDFASDPVVTLCGHLYCWPCIYRWLHPTSSNSLRQCPVCKSPLSESSLVPLYARGLAAKTHGQGLDIPHRPRDTRSLVAAAALDQRPHTLGYENHPFNIDGLENHRSVLHSTAGVLLAEMAFAMLSWAFTNPPGSYLSPVMGEVIAESPRSRRQEMRAEIWLKQLWGFLLCCALLCLFFF